MSATTTTSQGRQGKLRTGEEFVQPFDFPAQVIHGIVADTPFSESRLKREKIDAGQLRTSHFADLAASIQRARQLQKEFLGRELPKCGLVWKI